MNSSPPARSRRDPTTISLASAALVTGLRSVTPVTIGKSGRGQQHHSYLAVLANDGSLHTFELLSMPLNEGMDLDAESSATPLPVAVWSKALESMAAEPALSSEQDRDWEDKAATKHKILDLLWTWRGVLRTLPDMRLTEAQGRSQSHLHRRG